MAIDSNDSFQNIFTREPWKGQEFFSDATLKTEDGCEFRVHRIILSQKSKYFKGLFTHASEYERINGIYIKDIDGITLNAILLYVYLDDVDFNNHNIWNILITADFFLMDDLVDKIWSFSMEHLHETCIEAVAVADGKLPGLRTTTQYYGCYRYLIVHFQTLSSNNIGILPFNTFKTILNHNSLNVTSEENVWKAVVSWVEVNKPERLEKIEELLKFIRLEEDVDDLLAANILSSSLVKNNPYFPYQNLKKHKNVLFPNFYNLTLGPDVLESQPRRPHQLHYIIDDSTTTSDDDDDQSHLTKNYYLCLTYDDTIDFVRKICLLAANKIVKCGHHLYIFDRWPDVPNEIFSFNILNESVTSLHLPTYRYCYSLVAVGDSIYVIGGETEDGLINSTIDCYHTSLESWTTITVPGDIFIENAVSLQGCIYMLGWEDDMQTRSIFLIYNPENNSWSVTSPTMNLSHLTPVSHNGNIYFFGTSRQENIEVYNTEKRTWTTVPPLPSEFNYRAMKAKSIGDKLVVCDTYHFLQWDINSNKWIDIQVTETLRNVLQFPFYTVEDKEIIDDLTRKNRRSGIHWEKLPFPSVGHQQEQMDWN